ncbi:hypothetical protein Ancab_029076 [Ancistrocladus abbreviatus]
MVISMRCGGAKDADLGGLVEILMMGMEKKVVLGTMVKKKDEIEEKHPHPPFLLARQKLVGIGFSSSTIWDGDIGTNGDFGRDGGDARDFSDCSRNSDGDEEEGILVLNAGLKLTGKLMSCRTADELKMGQEAEDRLKLS